MSFKNEALVIGAGFLGNSFKEAGFEVIKHGARWVGNAKKYIINTVGLTDIDRCENYPSEAKFLNSDYVISLEHDCREIGAKLIHISTAHIYGKQNKRVDESSPCRASSIYGISKFFGDEVIKDSSLIIRGNLFYSEYDHPKNLFNKLRKFRRFSMEANSVTCCESIVSAVEELKDEVGVYNISDDVKSMWSIAQIMGLGGEPAYSSDILKEKEGLHPNVVMDCKKQLEKRPVAKIFEKFALNLAKNV